MIGAILGFGAIGVFLLMPLVLLTREVRAERRCARGRGELPCPVCGAADRNCYGQVTSACGGVR